MQTRFRAVALLLCTISSSRVCAQSDPIGYSNIDQPIAALEEQESLERIDTMLEVSDDQPAPSYRHHGNGIIPCNCEACQANPSRSFWYVGLELTALNASVDSTTFGLDGDTGAVGPRITVGWESDSGFGLRSRFAGMSAEADMVAYGVGPTPLDLGINAARFDFDLYRRFEFENGSLLFGAGVSSAQLEYELIDGVVLESMKNTGAGVSVFAEGRHRFYNSATTEWAVLSRGRWGAMIGEEETTLFPGIVFDSTLNVAEAAFGFEYKRKMRRATFVAQYLMEAQSWSPSELEGVNFLGSTASVGFTW
jgi:hypothetical protein